MLDSWTSPSSWHLGQFCGYQPIQAETALMYDAVHLFAKALHDLDTSQQIDIHPLSCDAADTWPHGYSLINYMKIGNSNVIN
ncbi:glutamate receptor, ionotropic kainate 1, 2, 3 [Culex quinquefasciatus]|uniref:Glutamate receptor, ionotropic kainate 1, 2, 3 n=1 Tax=Culex quinquefasciatus TaxID=7176 RepID=B0XLT7_CULQU|nr:glutamate receptor, ionotropic kainate 1, 2, 3 [Culex quinquefasciatus]|eukprot:XP_001870608.1 glutamate receptor, ionotropic kainate 1, 2, 3 [Culex quinquefasciatus]